MSKMSGEENAGDQALIDEDSSPFPDDGVEDPVRNAASRGDNPMGMFAGDDDSTPEEFRLDLPPLERRTRAPETAVPDAPTIDDRFRDGPALDAPVPDASPSRTAVTDALISDVPVPAPTPADPSDDVVRRLRETARQRVVPPPPQRRPLLYTRRTVLIGAIAIVAILAVVGWAFWRRTAVQSAAAAVPQDGHLSVESLPTGAPIEIDGVARGTTPLGVRLPAGRHVVRVGGPTGRQIDVVVAAGGDVAHHIELAELRTRLHIATEPGGGNVRVDGQLRGTAPLDLDGLAPGMHTISVESSGGTVRREVNVRAGADNSVVIALGGGGPTTGFVSVSSPFDVDVYERDRLVGRSRDGQLLLIAGRHELTLANTELGYQDTAQVLVSPGATARITVRASQGQLNVNAIPWAEVFVDGQRVGETPISNYTVPIGRHEVLLRHPQLGEQRRTVVVTVGSPARVGANFTR